MSLVMSKVLNPQAICMMSILKPFSNVLMSSKIINSMWFS